MPNNLGSAIIFFNYLHYNYILILKIGLDFFVGCR